MTRKYFRGQEVEGWFIITSREADFQDKINELMEEYEFEDFQYSTSIDVHHVMWHSAAILLKKKSNRVVKIGSG
jgi:hypothetical protein